MKAGIIKRASKVLHNKASVHRVLALLSRLTADKHDLPQHPIEATY